jgi:hypothetical protein
MLANFIQNIQEYRFVVRTLFKINSLTLLQALDLQRFSWEKLTPLERENLYFMIALVRASKNPLEAKRIFQEKLK